MAFNFQPVVGDWYQDASGGTFEVVAYDFEEEAIEIQYFDGAIEELDLETWIALSLIPAEPPEDWSGSMDLSREDYGVDLDSNSAFEFQNPLDEFDHQDPLDGMDF